MGSRSRDTESRPLYDITTAVTFLLAGLGIGSLFGIVYTASLDRSIGDTSERTQQSLPQHSAL